MKLTSPAFENNSEIPKKYTGEGLDINPPLVIEDVPADAKSLVLIIDDPDAPMKTWDHWIVWNIPSNTKEIKEGSVPENSIEGINDFKRHSYGGPYPPPGKVHHYNFKLYALDKMLDIPRNSKKEDVENAMKNHILARSLLIGTYKR